MVQGVQLQETDTHALKDTAEALSAEPQSFVFIVSQHCIINGPVRRNITLNTDKRLRNCKTLAPESESYLAWPCETVLCPHFAYLEPLWQAAH